MKRTQILGNIVLFLLVLSLPARAQSRTQTSATPARFDFALIGDVPYNDYDATNSCPNLIAELNERRLAFVVHDGDIKSGASDCTDELFYDRYRLFQSSKHPFIYTFGDNEWTDCDRVAGHRADPMERLGKLREIFTQGDRSLGRRTLPLRRQSVDPIFAAYRENVRWLYGGVLFATLNVPGSDNHYRAREFGERNRANLAWLHEAFEIAAEDRQRAIMLIMQANPHFELASTNQVRLGFNSMLKALEEETIALGKPVVLVHGDTHYFRIDKPLLGGKSNRRLENFTRVETFGNPDVHWLRVRVDPQDPGVFTFHPQIVSRNVLRHR